MMVQTLIAGKDGWTDWVYPIQGRAAKKRGFYKLICCSCAHTHEIDFRPYGKEIEFRVKNDWRATAAQRRSRHGPINHGFAKYAARTLAQLYADCPDELEDFIKRFREEVKRRKANGHK